ncbi:MAG: proline dehydrogenase family protein [Fidelibacterota bacterium]|nr:MAG: proline dehydrogenase family protein [Candidatus Neomarinimicrobiota bacterium]
MAVGLNRLLVATLPLLPKALVGLFARTYVAGDTPDQAFAAVKKLNDQGFETTLDILGEHVESTEEAETITEAYASLYHDIARLGLRANISLKPTHLGLDIQYDFCERNVFKILDAAQATNNFLRIDMENSPHTDATLQLYQRCLERYPRIGPVLQAYLYRSADDLGRLMNSPLNFRLCKGIYRESPEIAIQERSAINANFLALARQAFEGNVYTAIATHDVDLIRQVEELIREKNLESSRFEFQALYGVPMGGVLEELKDKGYTVRIYVPFGEAWHAYALRRAQENPNLAGYVLRNFLARLVKPSTG